MEINSALASRIVQLLNERNWSVYRLAVESGIPYSTLSNIILLKGKSCTFSTLIDLCRGFPIELREFLNSPFFLLSNLDDNR